MNTGSGWKGYSGGLLTMVIGCAMLWWASQTRDEQVRAHLLTNAGIAIPGGLALFGIRQAVARSAAQAEQVQEQVTAQVAAVERKVEAVQDTVQDATGAGGPRG